MFGLLTRSRRTTTNRPRGVKPLLERLETRDCPAGPTIIGLTAQVLPNHIAKLTGMVTDPNPASVQINFNGALSGSTTTDANGNFSYQTTGTGLGTVTATATDIQNQTSAPFSAQLSTAAPTITLSISYGANKLVTLTGTVTDIDAAGRLVTFSGVVTSSATTTSNGSFTLSTNATGLGNITASVTDLWSQTATRQIAVAPAAPTISNFDAREGLSEWWTFTGIVSGPYVQGEKVTFAGMPEVAGEFVYANADGTFTYMVQLPDGVIGSVTAQAIDAWGQTSNQPCYAIS